MTLVHWLRRHPLLGYFAAAYGISWGGILVVLAITGFDLVQLRPMDTGLVFILMLLGPSTAGLAMTALLDGRPGLRNLRWSLVRWRVAGRWYVVALLTAPTLLLAVLSTFSFVDAAFAPRFQWPLFAIGLVAGSVEEIGWTGFATPRLMTRRSLFMAGFSLGVAWALWHAMVDFRQNANAMGMVWLLEFAVLYVAALTAYRVLMTWVFAHTQSLLLAVLMHASYTGWLLVLFPATSITQGLAWQIAFAALLWAAVAVVMTRVAHRTPLAGSSKSNAQA
jgi:membrane protease YdiL (CAAX protease family)